MNAEPSELPEAVIRRSPEDFVVEELPAYPASGKGEHLFITFRKRGLTTPDAVRALARELGVDPRFAGWAGMKDRHAVTTQTVSFSLPMARDAAAAAAKIAVAGLDVIEAQRHDNKLKPGHLLGNRFTIVLRGLDPERLAAARAALDEAGRVGVPNAFGPQRFGRDGDNAARALAWLAGKERGPRDKRDQRMLFSALQSLLFNEVLARRVAEGTWSTVLAGDVAKKHDSGGLFDVPLEGPELDDARARAEAGAISATGPMYGAKMRWPAGEPLAAERAVLDASALDDALLEARKSLGEGTRRALRLEVHEMAVTEESAGAAGTNLASQDPAGVSIVVRFVLPKGGYATTVLGRAFRLRDASLARPSDTAPESTPESTPDAEEEPA
ncbi:MAG: tRNA pseudouridine(13) synthase TruD [Byssovorax sp.]